MIRLIYFFATLLYNCSEKGEMAMKEYTAKDESGYFQISEAVKSGMTKETAMHYARDKKLIKVAHGVYQEEGAWPDPLYLLQLRNKKIVFSHETALFLHGLSDREASHPVVTVQRGYNAKHLKDAGVVVHTVMGKWFDIGLSETETNAGNPVKVYDRERCICDIIRARKRMDPQVFQTAIRTYFSDAEKDIRKLLKYSREFGQEEIVRQYAEVLL